MMSVLLDSVILIDPFNGHEEATAYLRSVRSEAAVSAITRAEVLTGFDDGDAFGAAAALMSRLRFLPVGREEADAAARSRRLHRWKRPGAIQAAVAQGHGLSLATRNTKDFDPAKYPFVVVPYSPG